MVLNSVGFKSLGVRTLRSHETSWPCVLHEACSHLDVGESTLIVRVLPGILRGPSHSLNQEPQTSNPEQRSGPS